MLHKYRDPSANRTGFESTLNTLPRPTSRAGEPPAPSFLLILSRRCSSFFAEAAVLVLVFGILDYFMLKGRIRLPWIAGAFFISLALLAASTIMDFTAQRWVRAHP